jgi:hypothetical protein
MQLLEHEPLQQRYSTCMIAETVRRASSALARAASLMATASATAEDGSTPTRHDAPGDAMALAGAARQQQHQGGSEPSRQRKKEQARGNGG